MKVFITGADGFIGSHLVEYIYDNYPGTVVYGTKHNPQVDIEEIKGKIKFVECDIRNKALLNHILEQIKPDKIFHLAAQSYPTISWTDPINTINDNVIGTVNLFECVKELNLSPVILVACSSAQYGFVPKEEMPIKEDRILMPLHPYGVSKVTQDLLAYQYFKNYGIRSIRARIFNTTGPRKVRDVTAEFSMQIAEIESGNKEPIIYVGNLETARDISDGRDIVRAMWLSTEKGEFGEAYNFCSGEVKNIKDILNNLLSLTEKKIEIKQNPEKIRTTDELIILGDNSKLKEAIGWEPKISFEETVKDTLEYWRKRYSVK